MTNDSKRKMQRIPFREGALILFTAWSVLVASSLGWSIRQAYQSVLLQAESEANGHFNKDTVYRRWASLHGGIYVPVTEKTPPSPYLDDIPERDITTPSGRRLTLVNPAYMTRQVQELSQEQYGVLGHITSLQVLRPGNEPDEWEKQALLTFNKEAKAVSAVTSIDGVPYLRFMRPFITEKSCLKCHAQQGYKVEDVRGGISVSVPLASYYAQRRAQIVGFVASHLLIYLFGSVGIWFGSRLLRIRERENRLAWELLTLDEDRFRSLLALSGKQGEDEGEIVAFAVEEAVRLTGSLIGYFHFYDETHQIIKLSYWTTNVEAQCKVAGMEKEYPLEQAGIWADCLRQRRSVIHNDYQVLPEKKGCPDGHFPITRHLAVPVFDGEQIVAIIGVGNKEEPYHEDDITQLSLYAAGAWKIVKSKQDQAAVREGEQQLEATFEQAAVGVGHVAVDGHLLRVNRKLCDIVGYTNEELLGLTFQDITHPDDLEANLGSVRKLLSGELQTFSLEKRYIRKDRSLVWINITVSLVRDASGAPRYFIYIVEDIDERKQAELELKQYQGHLEELVLERTTALEESQRTLMDMVEDLNLKSNELGQANVRLRELDRLKSMFIASMSHELRTPLNSIIGFTGLIVGNMAGAISDEQRDMLERVSRAGKHLLSLITDVIDIAKIESGKIVPYPEEFDLHALFDEAVGQVRPQAEEKGLAMEVHLPEHPATISSDRKRLLQCLLNYLSNAVKFSEKGTVHVEVKTATKGEGAEAEATSSLPEGWLEISVSDTGIGIREEDMKLLFGSFVRLETPLKMPPPGTGLGLYLTKKLTTEVLGGTVGAESQEGRGSRFWLRMPMVSRTTK